jgi:hypothetical protein
MIGNKYLRAAAEAGREEGHWATCQGLGGEEGHLSRPWGGGGSLVKALQCSVPDSHSLCIRHHRMRLDSKDACFISEA